MTGAQRESDGLLRERFRQYRHGAWRDFEDIVAPEEVLRVHVPGLPPKELSSFPDSEQGWLSLVLGHALLDMCRPHERPVFVRRQDNDFYLDVTRRAVVDPPAEPFPALEADAVLQCMGTFIASAGRWEHTGCFHRMALYAPAEERFLVQVEDIGRHNCLDRLAGICLERELDPGALALFVSARATGSLVAKAVRAGFLFMVSRSAVTSAGVRLAQERGLTLLGFAREIRFTVFADSRRLVHDPESLATGPPGRE